MEVAILSMQARILLFVLLGSLGLGLWAEVPPATAAWRAALCAAAATWLAGHLLRLAASAIDEPAAENAAGPLVPATAATTATVPGAQRPAARERR